MSGFSSALTPDILGTVLADIAPGDVGSVVLMCSANATPFAYGALVAGSSLRVASLRTNTASDDVLGPVPSGTWRVQGYKNAVSSINIYERVE